MHRSERSVNPKLDLLVHICVSSEDSGHALLKVHEL
jgi:hypothetical protein